MEYPGLYLLNIRHTGASGAADWYQYSCLGEPKD